MTLLWKWELVIPEGRWSDWVGINKCSQVDYLTTLYMWPECGLSFPPCKKRILLSVKWKRPISIIVDYRNGETNCNTVGTFSFLDRNKFHENFLPSFFKCWRSSFPAELTNYYKTQHLPLLAKLRPKGLCTYSWTVNQTKIYRPLESSWLISHFKEFKIK